MKILIRCTDDIIRFYHYDDREFKVGDEIRGYDHDVPEDIFILYSLSNEELNDISQVVYCLDHQDSDYDDTYRHCYVVRSDRIFKRMMDYSILVCSEDITNILTSSGFDSKDKKVRRSFIQSMVNAYLGNNECMELIRDKYKYPVSNNVEYICDKAEIVDIIK